MVKQINFFIDDEVHVRLMKVKGKLTWNEFMNKIIEDG